MTVLHNCVCVYVCLNHSLVDRYLHYFQFLAVVNKYVVNILVQAFFVECISFLLSRYLEAELMDRVGVCLDFYETTIHFQSLN